MSRPGYWKTKAGEEIPVINMEDSHLKHSMRYLRNIVMGHTSAGNSGNSTAATISSSYRRYAEIKLVELGNEAQRRGLVEPGNVSFDRLMAKVEEWQTEWDNRPNRPGTTITAVTPFIDLTALLDESISHVSSSTPKRINFTTTVTVAENPFAATLLRNEELQQNMSESYRQSRMRQAAPVIPPRLVSKTVDVEMEISSISGIKIMDTTNTDPVARRLDMDL